MTKPIVRIHDIATDEVIDREMNDAEFIEYQAQQAATAKVNAEAAAKAEAKAALLEKLGISEAEAKLLLG
jgi:hypothetical protein